MLPSESAATHRRPAPAEGHDLIRSVVLVDRPEVTVPVAKFLRGLGWTAFEASNCGQARGLIARFSPEFVIAELLLPLETGFELCAYVKKTNCRIGVMILTEVGLEESRNLAMWAGADAYLVKPTYPEKLYSQLIRAALHISQKISTAESGMSGPISFRCKCGKALKAGSKHAGRAMICPSCKSLAKCPDSLLDAGTLFRTLIQDRQGIQVTQTGIVCPHCKKTVDPSKCRIRDHYECTHCRNHLKVSSDFMDQWSAMFADRPVDALIQEPNPLQYVYVQCDSCRNLFNYFNTTDEPQPCPSCGANHSLPSIRGVPISRAALAATGRLFEVFAEESRSRLFLLPARGRYRLGRAESCSIRLQQPSVEPVHAVLNFTMDGPMLSPGAPGVALQINQQPVKEPQTLHPGDEVQMGRVRILLHGTPARLLKRHVSDLLTNLAEENRIKGEMTFGEPGARLLQLHWELQRWKWVTQQHQLLQNQPNESALP